MVLIDFYAEIVLKNPIDKCVNFIFVYDKDIL